MSALSIVDSHVHLWNPAQLRYSWLDGLPGLNRAFLPAGFCGSEHDGERQQINLCRMPAANQHRVSGEVDWVSGLAKAEPRLKGIVAHAPLEKGKTVRANLEQLASRPLVKGVRRFARRT